MFIDEIIAKWITDGLVTASGTTPNVFWGPGRSIPAGDGPFVQIIQTGGVGPEYTQDDDLPSIQKPSAQITVIARSIIVAHTKARALYNSICRIRNRTLSGTWYLQITPDQEPFDFPVDAAGRARIVFNILAHKKPS